MGYIIKVVFGHEHVAFVGNSHYCQNMANMATPMIMFVVVNTIDDFMNMLSIWTRHLSTSHIFVIVNPMGYIIYL
jgi:hypothetical protein